MQRLGMMTLLGQHGQPMDYEKGIKLVSYSAQTADENAPQGAYVRFIVLDPVMRLISALGLWHAASPRITSNQFT